VRRIFRRHIRKTLGENVPPVLQEANFAFDKGEYGRAAELFERIAETASRRGGPRAPLLHLQAGRARILARQARLGMPSLRRGLELLAEHRQFPRLHQLGRRVVSELRGAGLEEEADEIDAWLQTVLRETAPAQEPQKHPVLPTHCPSCGAGMRPDEVEWLDEVTAECAYCGGPVRVES